MKQYSPSILLYGLVSSKHGPHGLCFIISSLRDFIIMLQTLTADRYGERFLSSGTLNLWGTTPNACTGHEFWGCERHGNANNFLPPAQSARMRSVRGFSTRFGKIEIRAKMPLGDWLWPGLYLNVALLIIVTLNNMHVAHYV